MSKWHRAFKFKYASGAFAAICVNLIHKIGRVQLRTLATTHEFESKLVNSQKANIYNTVKLWLK